MISHKVGKMSLVTVFTSLVAGRDIAAGHSIMPGTRIPPPYIVPFLPRNGDVTIPPSGVPLSPQYHSSVSLLKPRLPNQSLS